MEESLTDESKDDKTDRPAVSPQLAFILGNALKSSDSMQQQQAGLETKKCSNCGAARPADTNLQFCDYCNASFY